ncbi:MAG: cytochrome bc complex cytochrome b subunit [Deltaproteobacteria bacterium]|nr:cytochrome bc complex cytochrome b subunit [Deltaproteobacteria bacterium]
MTLSSATNSNQPQVRPSFFAHIHVSKISLRALKFCTTWGLGIVAITLVAILLFSGLLLGLHYVPTSSEAYRSIIEIEYAIPFGQTLRALHRWSADALLIVVALHVMRIVFMAAYHKRLINWIIGLSMGSVVLLAAFTGYVLPWDQRAFWAARVVAGLFDYIPVIGSIASKFIFGGAELYPSGLPRVHALHVTLFPVLLIILIILHVWRIRRDGGLATSIKQSETLPAWPHLYGRELLLALVVFAIMLLLATNFSAPLGPAADYIRPANPEKAPWYFLGVQELASRGAVLGALVVPILLFLLLIVLPIFDQSEQEIGHWPRSYRLANMIIFIATFVLVSFSYHFINDGEIGEIAPLITTFSIIIFTIIMTWRISGRRLAFQLVLISLVSALLVFTIVGICRGADWVLCWPI